MHEALPAHPPAPAQGVSGVENVLTQHQPLLVSLLDQLAKGRLPKAAFPYVGAEPSVRVSSVIVFIVGGVTFEEAAKVGMQCSRRSCGWRRAPLPSPLPPSPDAPESHPLLCLPPSLPPSLPRGLPAADRCHQCRDAGPGRCCRARDGCWQRCGPPALPRRRRGHAGGQWAAGGGTARCVLAHWPPPLPPPGAQQSPVPRRAHRRGQRCCRHGRRRGRGGRRPVNLASQLEHGLCQFSGLGKKKTRQHPPMRP